MIDDWDSDDVIADLQNDLYRRKLNAEWSTLVALRDTMGIALKGDSNRNATYKQALLLGQTLAPTLFDPENSLLNRQRLSETARKYIQIAEVSSEPGKQKIPPEDFIKKDIAEYEMLLKRESPMTDVSLIKKDISNLRIALNELDKRKSSENSLIFRDAFQVTRYPNYSDGRDYRQYRISDKRALRIRVLHPNKPEYATGTDLIYENYWKTGSTTLVRLAALQYKVWRHKTLHIDGRIEKQLEKMKKTFCDGKLCEEESKYKHKYRLPYCAAFLRPTEELQSADSSLVSLGCYAPICVVNDARNLGSKSTNTLHSKDIRSGAVSHKIFEEMFNANMIGSKWLTCQELEDIYHANSILEPDEHIIIHAQEIPLD